VYLLIDKNQVFQMPIAALAESPRPTIAAAADSSVGKDVVVATGDGRFLKHFGRVVENNDDVLVLAQTTPANDDLLNIAPKGLIVDYNKRELLDAFEEAGYLMVILEPGETLRDAPLGVRSDDNLLEFMKKTRDTQVTAKYT
jgi:hypothetical protein